MGGHRFEEERFLKGGRGVRKMVVPVYSIRLESPRPEDMLLLHVRRLSGGMDLGIYTTPFDIILSQRWVAD